jgi:hypothetical protein
MMNEHFMTQMNAVKAEHKAQIDQLSQSVAALANQNHNSTDQNPHSSPSSRIRSSFRGDFKLIGTFNGSEKSLVFEEWRFSIEDYLSSFQKQEVSERETVLFVSQRLEGSAKTWYQTQVKTLGLVFSDYDHLLNALQIRTNAGKLPTRDRDLLAALKQTSSITYFIQRLNTIRARLDITDDEAQDRFRRGLKKEIRVKVDSTSLTWTDLAKMQIEALKQEGVTNY